MDLLCGGWVLVTFKFFTGLLQCCLYTINMLFTVYSLGNSLEVPTLPLQGAGFNSWSGN